MIWLSETIAFPAPETATKEGIIALGGDLSVPRLVYAYQHGIFPWFSDNDPIVWYCPPKRMVLYTDELHISKTMRQLIKKNQFTITENKHFEAVIHACKTDVRAGEPGTWITDDMEQAYIELHKKGFAKSLEVWQIDAEDRSKKLVGGLYGVDLDNGIFCGESMFSHVSNASKYAFIYLAQQLDYKLIDCQMYNDHLASLGAREIPRKVFLRLLH